MEHANLNLYSAERETLGEALLTPTKLYVKPVLAALEAAEIHGFSHITAAIF